MIVRMIDLESIFDGNEKIEAGIAAADRAEFASEVEVARAKNIFEAKE